MVNSVSFSTISHTRYKYELEHAYNHVMRYCESLTRYRAVIRYDDRVLVSLSGDGLLHIGRSYAYDGPSGPALDTMNMARASLVHDAVYQLIAAGELPLKPWKGHADREFRLIMREDGVPWWRRQYAFWAVRLFGGARDRFDPDGLRSHRGPR